MWDRVLARIVAVLAILGAVVMLGDSARAWPLEDLEPLTTIRDGASSLSNPRAVTVGPSGHLYVANSSANSVTVYAPTDSGGKAPLRILRGPGTGLLSPRGISFDSTGQMFVLNSDSVAVFSADWTEPTARPIKILRGGATGIIDPQAIAFDSSDYMYVANAYTKVSGNGSITVYPPDWKSGDSPPVKTLIGANTQLKNPTSLAFDSQGRMIVLGAMRVTVYPIGWESGDSSPLASIPATSLGLQSPLALALDDRDFIFTTSASRSGTGLPSLAVHAPLDFLQFTPLAEISGSLTGLGRPFGLTLGDDNRPLVANDSRNSVTSYDVQTQLISVPAKEPVALSARTVDVSASSSSSLAVKLDALTPEICEGSGTTQVTLRLVDVGNCIVQATQAGDSRWIPAPPVRLTVTVKRSPQLIKPPSFGPVPLSKGIIRISTTASSGLPVIWRSLTPSICMTTRAFGQRLLLMRSGNCLLETLQPGNRIWEPAPSITSSLRITRK